VVLFAMAFNTIALTGRTLTADPSTVLDLPIFRVEGTTWQYAQLQDMEILTRASPSRSREVIAALIRGRRTLPAHLTAGRFLPLQLILVDELGNTEGSRLGRTRELANTPHRWQDSYHEIGNVIDESVGQSGHLIALNLHGMDPLWKTLMSRARWLAQHQSPAIPVWALSGMFGECGPFRGVIGIPNSASVRFAKLSWPDLSVAPGAYPPLASEFPAFSIMFDMDRTPSSLPLEARRQFDFQTALFTRWSLFGPAKNGRDRNGYWALVEFARRGPVTEDLFRECYGMNFTQACVEMRAYLRGEARNMIEVRMPAVMADAPEVDNLKFRTATPTEVERFLANLQQSASKM